MPAGSRGNGTNFDWLRKSCDISTCDLSHDGNPEKYRRPMKSAIIVVPLLSGYDSRSNANLYEVIMSALQGVIMRSHEGLRFF